MKSVVIPENYNYIAVFLTLSCNLACSYCINRFEKLHFRRGQLSGEEWVHALNRIVSRNDLPITFGGGEPSLHPDFQRIVNGIDSRLNIDLLTNLQFDLDRFMEEVEPHRIRRNAPYASIRVSYHPEVMALEPLVEKVLRLKKAGYSIGIWGVMHPSQEVEVLAAREHCLHLGIDFRVKEFLGDHGGRFYGTIRYPGACDLAKPRQVLCRTTELIIGPSGEVYRCHSDLYEGRDPVGSIVDSDFQIEDRFRPCAQFGHCNPCDVKVKTDRFQQYGHTSVEVVFPENDGKVTQ